MDYLMDSFNLPRMPTTLTGWGKSLHFRLLLADHMLAFQESELENRLTKVPVNTLRPNAIARLRIKRKLLQIDAMRSRLNRYSLVLTGEVLSAN